MPDKSIRQGLGQTSSDDGVQESMPLDSGAVPQRTYITGMTVALGGVLMFFMALVSAYIVRKGFPNSDWRVLEVPRILWLDTLILAASSATLTRSRSRLLAGDAGGFRHWWASRQFSGCFVSPGKLSPGGNSPTQAFISRPILAAVFSMYSRLRTGCICSEEL